MLRIEMYPVGGKMYYVSIWRLLDNEPDDLLYANECGSLEQALGYIKYYNKVVFGKPFPVAA